MGLPTAWVDKIFTKMSLIYGREFIGRWEGLELSDVKTDWAHELSGFEHWPEAIAWAFQNLAPGKPPTVVEFRAICYRAPKPDRPKLPEPMADPARVSEELKKIRPLVSKMTSAGNKDWAYRIIARHDAGEKINMTCLRFAREALRLPV